MAMGPTDLPSQEQIVSVESTDVMFGRGSATLKHAGNVVYRQLIQENKERYGKAPRYQKTRIAEEIVSKLKLQGSRFVKCRDSDSLYQYWIEVDQIEIVEKVKQALREKPKTPSHNAERKRKSPEAEVQAFRERMLGGDGDGLYLQAPLPFCPPSKRAGQNANHCSAYGVSTTRLPVTNPTILQSPLEEHRVNDIVNKLAGNEHQGCHGGSGTETTTGHDQSTSLTSPLPTTNLYATAAIAFGMSQPDLLEWQEIQKMILPNRDDKLTLSCTDVLPSGLSLDSSRRLLDAPVAAMHTRTSTLEGTVAQQLSTLQEQGCPMEKTVKLEELSPSLEEEASTSIELFGGRTGDQLSYVERRQEQLYKRVLRDLEQTDSAHHCN